MDWTLTEESFILRTPQLLRPWYNHISNDEYSLKISHLGDGSSTRLKPSRLAVTREDPVGRSKGRYLIINDGERLWSPSLLPCGTELDSYLCEHAPGLTRFAARRGGLLAELECFLPVRGAFEFMRFRLKNPGGARVRAKLYALAEFLLYPSQGVDPVYYCWYTDSRWDPAASALLFDRRGADAETGFFRSLGAPAGWDADLARFAGAGGMRAPDAAVRGESGSRPSAGNPYAGIFRYDADLAPGGTFEGCVVLGAGSAALADAVARFPAVDAVDRELGAVRDAWRKKLAYPGAAPSGEGSFSAWARGFLPYQVRQQAEGDVRGPYRGSRDAAQDAMALCRWDAPAAARLIRGICATQRADGRLPRQWNEAGGPDDERDFRDLPFWLPLAVADYLAAGGDPALLAAEAPWVGPGAKPSSVADHIARGLAYSLRYRADGLLFMGAGDWNDALDGPGPAGGSVFLNQLAYRALSLAEDLAARHPAMASALQAAGIEAGAHEARLYDAVQSMWTGDWFARAVTAAGATVGGAERIFLLPQAWFTISGMARRDPKKGRIALDSMLSRLEAADGLLKCAPGFEEPDPRAGSVSRLAPGMAENYAVYNHASAFGAYALLAAGREAEGARIFSKLLPFARDPARSLAEPYVLVNFYNGGYHPHRAGEGGIAWLTGTANWAAKALFDFILPRGIRVGDRGECP